jgi:NADPH-ferrihemoprotein reductase
VLFTDTSTGKIYVQDLLWEARKELTPLILEKRAYIYICGDAKNMAKSVEERLIQMLAEGRGGTPDKEGAKEFKLLKDRNVSTT